MGIKRNYSMAMADGETKSLSPFMPMFETFKAELDSHHDRRERVIKASRDITAASKKIIFALQRVRDVPKPIPAPVKKAYSQYESTIKAQYGAVSKDLQGLNAFRYRSLSSGNQEFIEALAFQHYLETQRLICYDDACMRLSELGGSEGPILLTVDDYLLGVFDMVGELMRFAVTTMATTGSLPGFDMPVQRKKSSEEVSLDNIGQTRTPANAERSVLEDLRELRGYLERFGTEDTYFARDIDKKMPVMKQCVEKVENAVYGLIVRGSERPKGWMPDAGQSLKIEVESS